MQYRIPDETKEDIQRLFDDGKGISPAEIARRTGISYTTVYSLTRVQQRGFASNYEYEVHLAQQRGFESVNEYREYCAQHRTERKANRELGDLVKQKLKELGKNQSWLAEQLGVSRQAASFYAQGKSIPRGVRLVRLLDIVYDDHESKCVFFELLGTN